MNKYTTTTTTDIEKYAIIEKSEGVYSLFLGQDVPGLASHGAAVSAGIFNSPEDAAKYAQFRGIDPKRITYHNH